MICLAAMATALLDSHARAGTVIDAAGDLTRPFQERPGVFANLDIHSASASLTETRTADGQPLFGNLTLDAKFGGDVTGDVRRDYYWVINRGLGEGHERTLFASEQAPDGVIGDALILARGDGEFVYRDLSALVVESGRPLGRVTVDGAFLRVDLPVDVLLSTPQGPLAEADPFRFTFSLVTALEPLEERAGSGRPGPLVADLAPEGGQTLKASGHDPVTVGAAPEPQAWAMMLGGFGLTGALLRRRRALRAA